MKTNEKEHVEHLVASRELVLNIYELLLAIFLRASLDPIMSPSLFESNVWSQVLKHGCSISAGSAFAIVLGHPGYRALGEYGCR